MPLEGEVPGEPELMRHVHDRATREIKKGPWLGCTGLQGIEDGADEPITHLYRMGGVTVKFPTGGPGNNHGARRSVASPRQGGAQEGKSYPAPDT